MPVKKFHSTLVFFKGACHAIRGAEKRFVGSKICEKCPNTEFLFRISLYLELILTDTPCLSVFGPNAGKCENKKSAFTYFSRSEVRRY